MENQHYDTVRQQCSDCPDGSVWNERGPTDEVCPTCRGEAFVWVNAEPTAAIPMTTDTKALRERLHIWRDSGWTKDLRLGELTLGEDCGAAADAIERLEAERERYKAALAELVACKDLKDQADYNLLYAQTTGSLEKGKELTLEYRTRKGPAWSAARTALKEPKP